MESYYDILGVDTSASQVDIRKAYRKRSMDSHPDRNRGDPRATERFQELSRAFEVLSDDNRRREYNYLILERNCKGTVIPQSGATNNGIHSSRIPLPLETHLEIELRAAYAGSTEAVTIERWIESDDGTRIMEKEKLYVIVPRGADEGEIIIIEGKGNIGASGQVGDVKVFLHLQIPAHYSRQGLDLLQHQKITLRDAICGFTLEVPHISGKTLTIRNPAGTIISPGQKKTVAGLGMERDGYTGNLIMQFNVLFPDSVTPEVAASLSELL